MNVIKQGQQNLNMQEKDDRGMNVFSFLNKYSGMSIGQNNLFAQTKFHPPIF